MVLAPGVVAEAGGGAAEVIPVAVVTVGAVSVRDRVGWSVPVPTDALVVKTPDELLAAALPVDEAALPTCDELLLTWTLLVEVKRFDVEVLMATLVVDVFVDDDFGFGVGEGFVVAHWENCEVNPSKATSVQKVEVIATVCAAVDSKMISRRNDRKGTSSAIRTAHAG